MFRRADLWISYPAHSGERHIARKEHVSDYPQNILDNPSLGGVMDKFDLVCATVDNVADVPTSYETFQDTRHVFLNQECHFNVMHSPL
jgi:hypothetical protein